MSQEVVKIEKTGKAKFEDIQHLVSGERGRKVYTTGDPDYGVWTAGQVVGLIDDVPRVFDMVERIVREAVDIINGLGGMVKAKL